MSSGLISRSPDLLHLEDDGFEVEVTTSNYVLVHHVPYVKGPGQVAYGVLAAQLALQGDVVARPPDHVVLWAGELPCDSHGSPLRQLVAEENMSLEIRPGVQARFRFSQKPPEGYPDYYQKMTSYIRMIEPQAKAIDGTATALTRAPIVVSDDPSVFLYRDTASSRAEITEFSARLAHGRVAIVGLGGSGSYILDFIAKTPVSEIHLFDRDSFSQHNAFRSPGAPSLDQLRERPTKVSRFVDIYSRMRRGIFPHEEYINESNVESLSGMDFVFLCLDKGDAKQHVTNFLVGKGIPFTDVGMGLGVEQDAIDGLVRVTTFARGHADHLRLYLPFAGGAEDPYSQNIQIAELNALNAALAVIKWKKLWKFYVGSRGELNSSYWISENMLKNTATDEEKSNNA